LLAYVGQLLRGGHQADLLGGHVGDEQLRTDAGVCRAIDLRAHSANFDQQVIERCRRALRLARDHAENQKSQAGVGTAGAERSESTRFPRDSVRKHDRSEAREWLLRLDSNQQPSG
jgi:hypothetical protein